jgi:hypothetical protein
VRRVAVISAAVAALAALAACGAPEGVSEGAVVSVYVEAPLCEEGAAEEAAVISADSFEGRARYVCLPSPRRDGRLDLARAGANARRAAEDSAAVAFLEHRDPAVNRFTHPILEAAGIGWVTAERRGAAQRRALRAIAESGSGSREDVRESLEESR